VVLAIKETEEEDDLTDNVEANKLVILIKTKVSS